MIFGKKLYEIVEYASENLFFFNKNVEWNFMQYVFFLCSIYEKLEITILHLLLYNMWIMTKVFLVPEAKPRDTKHTKVIIHIIYFITILILMARSKAEGI